MDGSNQESSEHAAARAEVDLQPWPAMTAAASSFRLAPGDLVAGRYKVLGAIGNGGMGLVYRVEQVFLQKHFALKTLHSIVASDAALRRFQKEAQLASRLEHENLMRTIDFGLIDGQHPFLVMDFVEGETLADYLERNGRMPASMALKIFQPICSAIAHAHSEGVVHRDIKPRNIILVHSRLVAGEILPKIIDFGLAKLLCSEDNEQAITGNEEIFGTPLYMSPEQCSGPTVDCRSDIYALGCVLFETLTGSPPFIGDNALATMMKQLTHTALPLKSASLGVEFPKGLEEVVAKMLAKDPRARYQTCITVGKDLSFVAQNKPELCEALRASQAVHVAINPPRTAFSRVIRRALATSWARLKGLKP